MIPVYNIVGAKVIDIDTSYSIDISNLVIGTYVAVITDGITTSTSKFIKQQKHQKQLLMLQIVMNDQPRRQLEYL